MVENSVKLPDLKKFAFPLPPEKGNVRVIGVVPGQIVTEHRIVPVAEIASGGIARLAVIERHGKNGNIGYGYVSGTGIVRGAFATTIAHDSHNLLILGKDDASMRFAAATLREMGGGAVAVLDGEILAEMPLAVGGLMSTQPAEVVAAQDRALKFAAKKHLGITLPEPLTALSFLALPVIPSLKLTDRGLFDGENFEFVPLYFD
ncbi:MAG: hypothetical protein MJ033_05310 [Victivallaceae bacterium]|nr:hypothetical protein [Victivallaceae bacterium]